MRPEPRIPFPPTTDDFPSAYVGLDLEEARERALQQGWSTIRVIPEDGSVLLTLDFVTNRINFAVSDKHRVAWCSFY